MKNLQKIQLFRRKSNWFYILKHILFYTIYCILQVTKLEVLASKYNMKIIYCPKYHCELNAIEGLWCN